MDSSDRDNEVRNPASTAQARLRMVRVHAEQALGEQDRRAYAGHAATPPDARSIAREQLRRVADVHGDVAEPLVLDLLALQDCPDPQAQQIRAYAEQVLWRRRPRQALGRIFLRRGDLDALSALLHCSPEAVTALLGRLGLLA